MDKVSSIEFQRTMGRTNEAIESLQQNPSVLRSVITKDSGGADNTGFKSEIS